MRRFTDDCWQNNILTRGVGMFLTRDNKILWQRMGVGAIVTAVLVFMGIWWFDKPVFLLMRKLDCRLWGIFDTVFDAKIWILAALIAYIGYFLKKTFRATSQCLTTRNCMNVAAAFRDFVVKTKGSYAFLILCSVVGAGVVVKILKVCIGRARPVFFEALDMTGFFPPSFSWEFNSMPSGHTAVSFAGLVMIGMLAPKYKPLTWTLAIVIGVSRVAIGAHWPSDVIFGAFVGMVVADLVKGFLLRKSVKQ